MTHRYIFAVTLGAIAIVPAEAYADNVSMHFCVDYNVDYIDGSTGDHLTASTVNARGATLRFVRESDGYWFEETLIASDSDPGCDWITIDDDYTWDVQLFYKAELGGNTLRVKNASFAQLYTEVENALQPGAGFTRDYFVTTKAGRVLGAAGWAVHFHNVGVTGKTFDLILDDCPDVPGTSCERWPEEGIFIDDDPNDPHYKYKFIIVHEIGHAIADAANGDNEDDNDDGATLNNCSPNYTASGHKMNSKEYQSNAAVEGIAHFYSAITFNDGGGYGTGCDIEKHYRPDWNRDGDADSNDPYIFSCEGGIVIPSTEAPNDADVDNLDYLGDWCTGGYTNNRGTEYDWLRHFWDLYTDYGRTAAKIYEIWNHANPHTWNMTGEGTGGDYPGHRMHQGAYDAGGQSLQDDYDTCAAYNGTSR